MRIGLLVAGFPPDRIGGAELQSRQLAEQLAAAGHEVTVFTRKLKSGRAANETIGGFQVKRRRVLPVPGVRLIWDTFVTLWQVIRQRSRSEVLLCYQTVNSGLIGIVAHLFSGIPAVISIRGNEEYRVRSSLLKRTVVKYAYRRATAIAVQTPIIRIELLESLDPWLDEDDLAMLRSKLHVVPNGIVLPETGAATGNDILYVGRLIENKGVADLIAASRDVENRRTVIVGDGPDRSRLERLATAGNIVFAGLVNFDKVSTYLGNARMLVLPSHLGDGLPNVILEAMACGVPVIATRSAGIPDIIDDGITGLLYEPGDTETLGRLLKKLSADDQLHAAISTNALQYVSQYAWANVVPDVEAMLTDAIGNLQPRHAD